MTDDNSLFYRMLHNHNRGPIGEAAKRIAALKAAQENRTWTMGSDLLMACGCHFVDGVAVNLCELALVKNGVLLHVVDPVADREFSEADKKFLAALKVKA